MQFDKVDKWLSAIKDYHLPACLFMFVVGAVLQALGHMDTAFVAYTGTIVGGITGHAFSSAWKDGDDPNKGDGHDK